MCRDDNPERRLTPPVHLGVPGPWPAPRPDCDVCGALAQQREHARRRGDLSKVTDLNIEMRAHPHRKGRRA